MRRVLIAATIADDDLTTHDISDNLPSHTFSDPTTWEWRDFWADAKDGVVTENSDTTRTGNDKSVDWKES